MKLAFFAAAAAMTFGAPQLGRADVNGTYEPDPERTVIRRVYVEPSPVYREEVRVYRTEPEYRRVYREVPVEREVRAYREEPVYYYDERPRRILPPGPHRIITRRLFGP